MARRTALAIAGWLVAAVAATGTGLAAVQVIGAGLTGPAGEVRDADEVARLVAAPTQPPGIGPAPGSARPPGTAEPSDPGRSTDPGQSTEPGQSPGGTPGPGVPESRRALATPGGTVVAECRGADVALVSWTPAQGYRAADVDRGPDDDAEVTFAGSDHDIEVEVACVAGTPVATHIRDTDD
ncbi:septum formation initiator [Solwaraspora sp. WMMD1047]|uniref:septum formation initiator n=1 Tax=Solwaraspora sp. WMMD1047 TaxID=3016102 RepID=UPI002416B0AD|nr:septum formation initiator [Solwaraspora sp. WMMD1047]MDG4832074.1 septum formation initiator [Solwaraspora sp. WMMD1047]